MLPPGFPLAQVRRRLRRWYADNRRDLPWRRTRDPYRIWVAEVMLQQTRIEVVVPAYRRFLRTFPTLKRLAGAEEEGVLAAWSGLGYYSRARALHRAARLLVSTGCGSFPQTMKDARNLPGVGAYTAAAVLSIAYQQPHAAVDGNVIRVLSRLACLPPPNVRGEPQRSVAEVLLDVRRPGDWNQALVELGETVCLPRSPRCGACPLAPHCEARKRNATDRYPRRTGRPRTEHVPVTLTVVRDPRGRVLLERGAFPHLDHLWLPPARLDGAHRRGRETADVRGSFRHAILHRVFDVRVLEETVNSRELERRSLGKRPAGVERHIFELRELEHIGRSSLLTKAMRVVATA